MMEKWIKQEEFYKGKIFSLWGGQVELDTGEVAVREYIRHSGGVGIVPVVDGNVILIRQFRISIERELIELPAGRIEDGEEPMSCAARELEEEIGYRAGKLIPIASYFASVGNSNERMQLSLPSTLKRPNAGLNLTKEFGRWSCRSKSSKTNWLNMNSKTRKRSSACGNLWHISRQNDASCTFSHEDVNCTWMAL